ncbi:MAG: DUF4931 domain-containing protein [Selenomonadaceae bacterium]
MEINLIGFDITLGQKKPENIINQTADCPFCHREQLTNIIDTDGELLLLQNKYNVLKDAYQTVLIESTSCDKDIPDYSKEHMHALIRFGIRHWLDMISSGLYESVLFFKNHGPLSGGTIRHPHMQIIGFKTLDSQLMYNPQEFYGLPIDKKDFVEFNISTIPRIGFGELNVVASDNSQIDTIADYIQIAVDYLMHHFNKHCKSYNLFFYLVDNRICVKILPRFATSPLFIGYNIRFRPNNLEQIVDEIHKIYFKK